MKLKIGLLTLIICLGTGNYLLCDDISSFVPVDTSIELDDHYRQEDFEQKLNKPSCTLFRHLKPQNADGTIFPQSLCENHETNSGTLSPPAQPLAEGTIAAEELLVLRSIIVEDEAFIRKNSAPQCMVDALRACRFFQKHYP